MSGKTIPIFQRALNVPIFMNVR